jgi:hypothetical protein
MEFPYKRTFIKDINQRFENLTKTILKKNYENKVIPKGYNFKNKFITPNVLFTFIGEDYYSDVLSDIFNEQERIRTSKSKKKSLFDTFNEDKLLQKQISIMKSEEEKREYIYEKLGRLEATQFKPCIMIAVLDYFNSRKVLDMSSGWGDRLIGCIALANSLPSLKDPGEDLLKKEGSSREGDRFVYHGFDPNGNLQNGYEQIKKFNKNNNNEFIIKQRCFETLKLGEDLEENYYDLFFSSPPFFDLEIYSKDGNQSTSMYTTFDVWLVDFLFKSLFTVYFALKEKGNMLIHISDYYDFHICEPMCLFLSCIGMEYKGVIAHCNNLKNLYERSRPMWYFIKNKKKVNVIEGKNNLKAFFPNIYHLCEEKFSF